MKLQITEELKKEFLSKLKEGPECTDHSLFAQGPCLDWTGGLHKGYGRMTLPGGFQEYAQRIAWQMFKGPIPKGFEVLHRCQRRHCVRWPTAENPFGHLYVGTKSQNSMDKVLSGRAARGVKINHAKLTDELVHQIDDMNRQGVMKKDIAKSFDINPKTLWMVLTRHTWRHVSAV